MPPEPVCQKNTFIHESIFIIDDSKRKKKYPYQTFPISRAKSKDCTKKHAGTRAFAFVLFLIASYTAPIPDLLHPFHTCTQAENPCRQSRRSCCIFLVQALEKQSAHHFLLFFVASKLMSSSIFIVSFGTLPSSATVIQCSLLM